LLAKLQTSPTSLLKWNAGSDSWNNSNNTCYPFRLSTSWVFIP
jgi:hypothetical protein